MDDHEKHHMGFGEGKSMGREKIKKKKTGENETKKCE